MKGILCLTALAGIVQLAAAAEPTALPDDQVMTRTRLVADQIIQRPDGSGIVDSRRARRPHSR